MMSSIADTAAVVTAGGDRDHGHGHDEDREEEEELRRRLTGDEEEIRRFAGAGEAAQSQSPPGDHLPDQNAATKTTTTTAKAASNSGADDQAGRAATEEAAAAAAAAAVDKPDTVYVRFLRESNATGGVGGKSVLQRRWSDRKVSGFLAVLIIIFGAVIINKLYLYGRGEFPTTGDAPLLKVAEPAVLALIAVLTYHLIVRLLNSTYVIVGEEGGGGGAGALTVRSRPFPGVLPTCCGRSGGGSWWSRRRRRRGEVVVADARRVIRDVVCGPTKQRQCCCDCPSNRGHDVEVLLSEKDNRNNPVGSDDDDDDDDDGECRTVVIIENASEEEALYIARELKNILGLASLPCTVGEDVC